eukprot:8256923-Alexandrium_andersonii.AAC.1
MGHLHGHDNQTRARRLSVLTGMVIQCTVCAKVMLPRRLHMTATLVASEKVSSTAGFLLQGSSKEGGW